MLLCDSGQLLDRRDQTDNAAIEGAEVVRQDLWRVALRIDRDEEDAEILGARRLRPLSSSSISAVMSVSVPGQMSGHWVKPKKRPNGLPRSVALSRTPPVACAS